MDIEEIKATIPHRYPFLLVDAITEQTESKIKGIKNVTINEPFFQGHFPDYPVMPGVLIVEALAQVGGAAILSKEENKGKIGFLAGIDKCPTTKRSRNSPRPTRATRYRSESHTKSRRNTAEDRSGTVRSYRTGRTRHPGVRR